MIPYEVLSDTISQLLDKYRPRMRSLVQMAGNVPSLLPSWKPENPPNEKYAKHIAELQIPTISGDPSLLLHGLGEVNNSLDEDRIARIPHVFSCTRNMYVTRRPISFLHQ